MTGKQVTPPRGWETRLARSVTGHLRGDAVVKITKLFAAIAIAFVLAGRIGTASVAAANAVTPSTNDINRANGWAHVDVVRVNPHAVAVRFIQPRNFLACFEYRTDGDTSQVLAENGGVNYNSEVTDGLYPYVCLKAANQVMRIRVAHYVEIRMVFGAETDERFDWTRFDAR
jgi:hypothetical protein